MYRKEIVYDYDVKDFCMYLDGELVGFASTYHEAEVTLDQLVFELTSCGTMESMYKFKVECNDEHLEYGYHYYSQNLEDCKRIVLTLNSNGMKDVRIYKSDGEKWTLVEDDNVQP